MGNAWFVKDVKSVNDPDEAISALATTNLRSTAVVEKQFAAEVQGYKVDSVSGSIELTKYAPDKLSFTTHTTQPQLAVFSDIYYAKGWNAYVNGQKVNSIGANYILRALKIPAGDNSVEFRFEPQSYKTGRMLSALGSVLILAMIGWFIYTEVKKQKGSK